MDKDLIIRVDKEIKKKIKLFQIENNLKSEKEAIRELLQIDNDELNPFKKNKKTFF